MTCAPFSTAIPDYAFPSTAEEPLAVNLKNAFGDAFVGARPYVHDGV